MSEKRVRYREKGVCKTQRQREGGREGEINRSERERPRERKEVHETAERQGGM